MNRVRGKSLIWTSIIAMLLTSIVAIPRPVRAQGQIYADPAVITVTDPAIDMNDLSKYSYDVNIMMTGAEDLYAYGFKIKLDFGLLWVSGDNIVVGSDTILAGQPDGIDVAKAIDLASGYLQVSVSTIGDYFGVYGDGKLATITVQLRDVGTTNIDITDVELIDSNLATMEPDSVTDGYFESIAASKFEAIQVMKRVTRTFHVNFTETPLYNVVLYAKVKNQIGPYPLYCAIQWELSGVKYFALKTATVLLGPNDIAELEITFTFTYALRGVWNFQVTSWYSYGGSIWLESTKASSGKFTISAL